LASGIPDLELNSLALYLNISRPEFNPNGGIMILFEFSIDKLKEKAGFSNTGVSNDDIFEKVRVGT